jgi:hypothetical protein
MCNGISQTVKTYVIALLLLLWRVYFGALIVTSLALCIGYLLAGLPEHIPWHKLIPTLLIAFPVYGSRSPGIQTWGGASPTEKIDAWCFRVIYSVGITWLAWDIFKGLI